MQTRRPISAFTLILAAAFITHAAVAQESAPQNPASKSPETKTPHSKTPDSTTTNTKPADKSAAPETRPSSIDTAKLDEDRSQFIDPASLKVLSTGFAFSEGPLYYKGALIVCDLGGNKIYSVAIPSGEKTIHRDPSDRAAGAALDGDGNLIVTHFTGKLTKESKDGITTIADKAVQKAADQVVEEPVVKPFSKLNDLAITSKGVIYFTDFGGGRDSSKGLYSWTPNVANAVKLLDPELSAANGVTLSPDGSTLYVAEFAANRIQRYTVGPNGAATDKTLFIDLSTVPGPGKVDGLKTDPAGNVWTTGPGGVYIISPTGTPLARIPIAGASNLNFGPANQLFITAGKDVHTATTITQKPR
jgi:gluconolactonase